MKKINFSDIDILKWGNDITITGMIMQGTNDESYIVLLPMEKLGEGISLVQPTKEQWFELQNQLDLMNVMSDQKTILRKSQRNIDQRMMWVVFRRDKFKCRYCGIDNTAMTVDHIITWESGGATHPDNLLTSCKKCNKKRGNLDYGSWLQHKYYLDKSQYLSEEIKKKNEEIVFRLHSLPRVSAVRSR